MIWSLCCHDLCPPLVFLVIWDGVMMLRENFSWCWSQNMELPVLVTQDSEIKITIFGLASRCSLLTRKPWCRAACCWPHKCFGEGLSCIQVPARNVCVVYLRLSALSVCWLFWQFPSLFSPRILVPLAWSACLGEPSERHLGKKVLELVLLKSSFLRVFRRVFHYLCS